MYVVHAIHRAANPPMEPKAGALLLPTLIGVIGLIISLCLTLLSGVALPGGE